MSSLNASTYRYSLGGHTGSPEWRAMSEEKAATNRKGYTKYSSKTPSQYENVAMAPLLPGRKNKPPVKITKTASIEGRRRYSRSTSRERYDGQRTTSTIANDTSGLYDRRTNRSFETPPREPKHQDVFFLHQEAAHGTPTLRRSTPHLVSDDIYQHADNIGGSGAENNTIGRSSATWCCGKFMSKQWKKLNNYD